MSAPTNRLKAAIADGAVLRGPFLSLGSETVAEIAGRAGFDYCLIDGEHGAWDPVGIRRQLMAIDGTGTPAGVRVPANEPWLLKQALDLGAQSIMIPMVNSAAEAAAAVAACRYPPGGMRGLGGANMRAGGYGDIVGYPVSGNDQICVIVQVESAAALADVEAIAATDGVDCVFIGPADLACDMGYSGDLGAAPVWEAIEAAVRTIARGPAAAGVFATGRQEAAMRAAGATVFGIGSDASVLALAMRQAAQAPE